MWRLLKVIQFLFGWPSRWKVRRIAAGKKWRLSKWDFFMLMPQRAELQRWFDENPIHFLQFIKFLEMMQRDLPADVAAYD